ncbi:MAG: BatD family protein [Bacteroidetes bacterium]|nr:BatD family protein [Bacteroidota bacterium]
MKWKLIHIILLILSIQSYGQVTIVGITDEKEFKQNKKFVLTFVVQINGSDLVQESPIKLPDFSKFEELGSASEQNTLVDQRNGTVINQIVYQYVLQPKQTGKLKIGSALVQVNGKMYKSESFDIFVKEADKKLNNTSLSKIQDQVFLNLEIKDKEVLQHQPTEAVLRVYCKDYDLFRKISKIHFQNSEWVEVFPVNLEASEIEPSVEYPNWLSQVIAIYSLVPNTAGKVEVPQVVAQVKNNGTTEKIYSNKVRLQVLSLPKESPKNYKDAIGKFEVSLAKNSKENYHEIGKPIEVNLKISGTGNLNYLMAPVLYPSKNYTFYKPKIKKTIHPQNGEFQGEIVAQYIVVPQNTGEITIKTDNFSFYDAHEKKYVDLGVKELPINVLTAEQIAQNQSTIEKVNTYTNTVLEKVENPILKTTDFKVKEKSKIDWKAVLGNLALVFAVLYSSLLYSKYRKNRKRKMQLSKDKIKPLGSVAETEAEIRKKKKLDIDAHLQYFEFLINEQKFDDFFKAYQEFETDFRNYFSIKYNKDLDDFLNEDNAKQIMKNWQTVQESLATEKFNPNKSADKLKELCLAIQHLYQLLDDY